MHIFFSVHERELAKQYSDFDMLRQDLTKAGCTHVKDCGSKFPGKLSKSTGEQHTLIPARRQNALVHPTHMSNDCDCMAEKRAVALPQFLDALLQSYGGELLTDDKSSPLRKFLGI